MGSNAINFANFFKVYIFSIQFIESILMSQKKALGTVTECTEICDDSVSLLGDDKVPVLNSSGLLTGKEQVVTKRVQLFSMI